MRGSAAVRFRGRVMHDIAHMLITNGRQHTSTVFRRQDKHVQVINSLDELRYPGWPAVQYTIPGRVD